MMWQIGYWRKGFGRENCIEGWNGRVGESCIYQLFLVFNVIVTLPVSLLLLYFLLFEIDVHTLFLQGIVMVAAKQSVSPWLCCYDAISKKTVYLKLTTKTAEWMVEKEWERENIEKGEKMDGCEGKLLQSYDMHTHSSFHVHTQIQDQVKDNYAGRWHKPLTFGFSRYFLQSRKHIHLKRGRYTQRKLAKENMKWTFSML